MFKKLVGYVTVLSLCAGLSVSTAPAQDRSRDFRKQEKRQVQRDLKEREKRNEEAERRMDLRQRIQPEVDRNAQVLARLEHKDPLAQVYVNSLGQSLVPEEVAPSVTFSFRIIYDYRPNAFAFPDGRIYVTTGLLSTIENEAQLAVVLGHEIAHVTEEHLIDLLRKKETSERRNRILGTVAGAAIGGIVGAKAGRGGAARSVAGVAAGAGAGFGVASLVNRIRRAKFNREQEREADLIGCELAMAGGFDPEEGRQLFVGLHQRYGDRPFKPMNALMGSHPPAADRASNIAAVLAGDLSHPFQSKRASGEIATGTGRFGRMLSAIIRDNGILLAERSDRHDLALESLERAQRYRPNDPRLFWSLGRVYSMIGRTPELRDRAEQMLQMAIQADQRFLYPAIHRDLAYLQAAGSDDYASAMDNLKQYVLGHIATHSTLPSDLEQVYDQLVLFGDNEWTPYGTGTRYALTATRDESPPASPVYSPDVWDSPGDEIGNYDETVALLSSEMRAAMALAQGLQETAGSGSGSQVEDSGNAKARGVKGAAGRIGGAIGGLFGRKKK